MDGPGIQLDILSFKCLVSSCISKFNIWREYKNILRARPDILFLTGDSVSRHFTNIEYRESKKTFS